MISNPSHFASYKQRHCTDRFCLILFIGFVIAYIVLAIIVISHGNPISLIQPSDSFGNICGQKEFKSRPYQFYYDISKCLTENSLSLVCPTIKLCVQSCPTYYSHYQLLQSDENNDYLSKNRTRQQLICVYNYIPMEDNRSILEMVQNNLCAPYTIPSEPFFGLCIPSMITDVFEYQQNRTLNTSREQMTGIAGISRLVASDLEQIKESLALFILLGGLLVVLYMFALTKIAGFIVFFTIIIFLTVLFVCSLYCWYTIYTGQDFVYEYSAMARIINDFVKLKTIYYIIGCLTTFFFVFSLILTIVSLNRFRLSVILLEHGANAIFSSLSTLFWSPIVPTLFVCLTIAVVYIQMCFSTIPCSLKIDDTECAFQQEFGYNSSVPNEVDYFTRTTLKFLVDNKTNLKWLNLFAYIWFSSFLFAFDRIVQAGVFGNYYWSKQSFTTSCPLIYSIVITIRYHLGSIVFGALVITLFNHLRMILNYLNRKLSRFNGCCLLTCFFWLFEKFLKFLNTNSYILIATHGYSFCKAARRAFLYISTNCIRFFIVINLTQWILLCGRICVSTCNVYFFYQYLQWTDQLNHLTLRWIPLILIGLLTYLICNMFFNVYNMAIKTFFLCFLEDFDENDGLISCPYVMNNELLRLVHKTNIVVGKE
ncbi:unnamed protein product [Adineta ricciae]|uniref:Choline transporter-like protein n=1 Tax=Adineta ricciae TaxID=249248 RepID=A0A813X3E5_ADIRI|nr:unnamed protein product [Adineta ricciae]CAF1620836.1 unnamed protein product [Adineta ricciae]